MAADIVVIGSYTQDFVWRTKHFPAPGETVAGTFSTGPGGKGSNQAVAAARTGVSTAFVGSVGQDAFGETGKTLHEREGIKSYLSPKATASTGSAAIIVDASGQNQIVGALGANLELAEEDIPEPLLKDARIVLGQPESNPATIKSALQKAHSFGATTILNPAPVAEDFDISIFSSVDILIPNELEFAALVRLNSNCQKANFNTEELFTLNEEALHALCRTFGIPTIIITLGEKGSFLSEKSSHTRIPAYSGLPVVDTTGAGDAFIGAFASGLIQFKDDLKKAIRYASVVAALAVSKPGAADAMPRAESIKEHLDSVLKG